MERPFRPSPQNAWEAARVRRAYNRRCVGAGFMYLGIYLAVQSVVSALYALVLVFSAVLKTGSFDPSALISELTAKSMLLAGIVNLISLLVYWIIFRARRCDFFAETRLRRVGVPALLLMLPLGFACHIFVSGALSLLPESWLSGYAASSDAVLGATDPLSTLCVVLIAPFFEEILFRGLFYTRLKRGMGKPLALLLASVLFGLLHGQLLWAAYAFLLSLLLCSVLDWYDSLWAGVLLHLSFNATQYIAAPFLASLPVLPALIASALLIVPLTLLARRCGLRARRA